MVPYKVGEARDWAKEHMRGCANVVIPSYSADLSTLNEAAIRHDIRLEIELGYSGTLLVSETALSKDEYIRFVEIAADEAKGRLQLIYHASFNTLEENIEVGKRAASAGCVACLLSFPPTFYPQASAELIEYTKTFADSVPLGVILFPVPLWGFERLNPAVFELGLLQKLIKDTPNIVAIKAEGGMPSIAGFTQLYRLLNDDVIVSFPIESQAIPLATLVPIQWIGTSNMEYFGDSVPKMFEMVQAGNIDGAMERFWQIHPARRVNAVVGATAGSFLVHRYVWKYQGWLSGFNGGPLRMPTMRVHDEQMQAMRTGHQRSGLPTTTDTDADFFVGRNPC